MPEGYELIAGTRTEDIHQYYKLSKVSIVANFHCMNLTMHIPLKSVNHSFPLYKIINLSERISPESLFSMLLTIHIWRYKSVNTAIYLSQRKTTANALLVASLYARWIQQYLIHKDLPVPLAYSSRVQTANNYVREIYFSTTNNQR